MRRNKSGDHQCGRAWEGLHAVGSLVRCALLGVSRRSQRSWWRGRCCFGVSNCDVVGLVPILRLLASTTLQPVVAAFAHTHGINEPKLEQRKSSA